MLKLGSGRLWVRFQVHFRFALGDAGWKTSLKSDDLKPEEQTGQEVRSGHGEPAG